MKKIRYIFFAWLLFSTLAQADIQNGAQFWNLNWVRGGLNQSRSWEYYLEYQPRFDFENAKISRFLLRPAVVYNVEPNQSLWLGMLDVFNSDFQTTELRPWEQYQRTERLGESTFLNRIRLEQRARLGKSDLGWRLRWMSRLQIPFQSGSVYAWVFFDEFFLGLNQNSIQKAGFDQNRAFVGIRYDLASILAGGFLEFGYMNQLTVGRMNHNPFLTLGCVIP